MLSLDFHCKENEGMTGAAHLIEFFFLAMSPDIRRVRSLTNVRSLDFRKNIWSDTFLTE